MNLPTTVLRPVVFCAALFLPYLSLAQEQPAAVAPATAEPAAVVPVKDPAAMEVIMKMADFLSRAPKFSVTIRSGYDAVQDSGQKIEFGETRAVTVKRPDRFRSETERNDGDKGLTVFNGKDILVYNETENFFALESKPGTIDQAINHFVKDLQMHMPLAMLYMSTLPAELDKRILETSIVEETVSGKDVYDHVAARTQAVDIQVWVDQGKNPLPRRVVLTYKDEEGQPQFWAEFTRWNMNPKVDESKFTFTPPKDAERIQFVSQVRRPKGGAEQSEVSQ